MISFLPTTLLTVVGMMLSSSLAETGYFWHINDLHYDPTYLTSRASCTDKNVTAPGKFGSYDCDSPWELLDSAMKALGRLGPQPDFIVWNGDNAMHAVNDDIFEREGGNDLILRLLANCTSLVKRYFPNTTVIPTIGNHDFYPKSQLPASANIVYNETFRMWSDWIGQSAIETFNKGAYYSMRLSDTPKVRAVVLNSNIWSRGDRVTRDMEDPADQFQWLDSVLTAASNSGDKVIVFSHIPPGSAVSLWWDREGPIRAEDGPFSLTDKFNNRFLQLVLKHHQVIITMMGAHHHNDYFHLFFKDGKPVNSFQVVPAISPFPWIAKYRNPGVRKYIYNKSTFELIDYDQYYLDLPADNIQGVANWKFEYSFRAAYDEEDLSHQSLERVLRKITENADLFHRFATFHRVSADDKNCQGPCRIQFLCSMEYVNSKEWETCMNEKYTGSATMFHCSLWSLALLLLVVMEKTHFCLHNMHFL